MQVIEKCDNIILSALEKCFFPEFAECVLNVQNEFALNMSTDVKWALSVLSRFQSMTLGVSSQYLLLSH